MSAQTQDWRRLDPLMLLVHPVNELARFLPALLIAFVVGSGSDNGGWWQALAVVAPVLLGLTRYLVTRYRITGTSIELRHGLLGRNVLTARLDRVRTVELTASPVHRVLGLEKVRVGTGAATGDEHDLELDALRRGAAEELRAVLLRARREHTGPGSDVRAPAYAPLLTFDPRWLRYAPFTSSGLVIAGALLGGLGQLASQADRSGHGPRIHVQLDHLGAALVVAGAVAALATLAGLAVVGYLVTYSGYALTRDPAGGTLHVVHGLLTRRETTLEAARVHGVELHEPLSLRLVGAARLVAAVTGRGRRHGGSSLLVPPAPRATAGYVGQQVLQGDPALHVALAQHGPRARRRRLTRALLGAAVPAAALAATGRPVLIGVAALLLAGAVPLALDRYRRLGHALTDRFLVSRHGSLSGRRTALERTGIIGWTIRQSFFQRRAGLCDLVATTSAGRQGYVVPDVPLEQAVALADAAVPGLLEPFRSAS